MKKNQPKTHLYILADTQLQDTDIGIGLTDLLESFSTGFKYSSKTFPNSVMWLSAKETTTMGSGSGAPSFIHDYEIVTLYYNSGSFQSAYSNGTLHKQL